MAVRKKDSIKAPIETAALETKQGRKRVGKAAAAFPIVGIGASAGGLAAFEAFFSAIPEDTKPGMAFVLVQHLAPDHKSILAELIQSYTAMQVFEVVDGMTVQINCVYIIPPGLDMALRGGRLQLLEPVVPRGHRLPINFFFRSLARDLHERAICIVLSGTGSDGAEGLRAVKSEGGMSMIQIPDSAEFNGMPLSALDTGLVDYQLLPSEMPAQLIAYTAGDFHPALAASGRGAIGDKALVQKGLLIGATGFFRDPLAFEALEERVIPKIFAGKSANGTIRVWSPGCSTGEEAYSLAILLHEGLLRLKANFKVLVFATDIDSQAIATARAGIYPATIADDITPERLARFFTLEPAGNNYRIHKNIRELLVFSEQNVINDPPLSKLDLISCRNLLMYMGGDLQNKLIPLFHYALNPGGYLLLGTSESVNDFSYLFVTLDSKLSLYSREADGHSAQHAGLGRSISPLATRHKGLAPGPRTVGAGKLSLRELTEQALLHQVAPTGALVRSNGDILYLHGRAGMYLEPAQGEIGVNNILNMAREGLRRDLTAGLAKAVTEKKIVNRTGLLVKTNGNFTAVNLTICPLAARPVIVSEAQDRKSENGDSAATALFLVILEEALPFNVNHGQQVDLLDGDEEKTGSEGSDGSRENARIATLRQELWAQEEYLQTAKEEFQSTSEEMRSVNEELQSTNEELETSREEMQSINEELATVNYELQTKVADLSRANNDMNNLLAGTGIATIFLDNDLRILRFTPNITRIISLIDSDMGRPLHHMVSNLVGYDRLHEDTQAVLDTLVPKEIEVQALEGSWYILRIRPYRTLGNVIEGLVLTFVDITGPKRAQAALHKANDLLRLAVAGRNSGDAMTSGN